jgi:hypothetical protein
MQRKRWPSLRHLSALELEQTREALSLWQSPDEFVLRVNAVDERVLSSELFNLPQLQFVCDALTLASFVRLRPVTGVRLTSPGEEWPDGQVRVSGRKVVNMEITEADREGRRRGEEYKPGAPICADGSVDNWIRNARAVPSALERAIKNKIGRNYKPAPTLLVDLNLNEYGIRQAEIEAVIRVVKERYRASFGDLLILWKDKLY